mgnify:CR=1 FL=1
MVLCRINELPIYKNTIAASIFKKKVGTKFDTAIDPPAIAPIKHASTNAVEEPINTARGFLVVLPKAIVDN